MAEEGHDLRPRIEDYALIGDLHTAALVGVDGSWAAVLRALVPGAAGTSGMIQARFTVANVIGGTLWVAAIAVAGYLVGASYKSLASNLGIAGDIIGALFVLLAVVWWVRARRHGPQASTAPPR